MKRGQFNDAKALLEANLNSGRNPDATRYHLGQLSVERGSFLEACQHWSMIQLDQIKDVRRYKRICAISKDYDLHLYKTASYLYYERPRPQMGWQTLKRSS